MKKEYDFSNAERGKFFNKTVELKFPIYLESKTQRQIKKIAEKTGLGITEIVNSFMRKEMDLLERFS